MKFSLDYKYLIAMSEYTLNVYDTKDYTVLKTFDINSCYRNRTHLTFSQDFKKFAFADWHKVTICDFKDFASKVVYETSEENYCLSPQFRDEKTLLYQFETSGKRSLAIYSLDTDEKDVKVQSENPEILAFSPNRRYFGICTEKKLTLCLSIFESKPQMVIYSIQNILDGIDLAYLKQNSS